MSKTALDLIHADQGGLVYQPILGLHRDVAEIDFISMYPCIMAHFNISPETVGREDDRYEQVPELNLWIDQNTPGLVPQTHVIFFETISGCSMMQASQQSDFMI